MATSTSTGTKPADHAADIDQAQQALADAITAKRSMLAGVSTAPSTGQIDELARLNAAVEIADVQLAGAREAQAKAIADAEAAAVDDATRQRNAQLEQIRTALEAGGTADAETLIAAMRQIETAVATIHDVCQSRAPRWQAHAQQLRALGCWQPTSFDVPTEKNLGLAVTNDTVLIDDRQIQRFASPNDARSVVNTAVERASRLAQGSVVATHNDSRLLQDPPARLRATL